MTAETQGFAIAPYQKFLWERQSDSRRVLILADASAIDPATLRAALERLTARCELLRTRFACPRGMVLPLQFIETVGPRWCEVPTGLTQAEAERQLAATLTRVDGGDAAVAALAQCGDGCLLLALSLSAYAVDAATPLLLLDALNHELAGEGSESLQYADFAQWQQENFEQLTAEAQDWRPEPIGRMPALAQVTPGLAPYRGAALRLALAPALSASLRGPDGEATALAAWSVLAARLGAETHPRLAVFSGGRDDDSLRGALGAIGFHLPFEVACPGTRSFADLRGEVARILASDRERHHDFFHARQLPEPPGAWGFSWTTALCKGPLVLRTLTFERDPFLLELRALLYADSVSLELVYDSACLSAERAEILAARYSLLLDHFVQQPHLPLGHAPLLLESERQHLLVEFNRTERADARLTQPLSALFAAQVARTPDAPAVSYQGTTWTYTELNARANRWAHHLRALGLLPESRVAICLPRSAEMMVAVWAVLKAGGTYLPLEPDDPPERLAYILEHGRARWLFTLNRAGEPQPELPPGVLALDLATEPDTCASDPTEWNCEHSAAYMIYTSGSTGRPKGVVIEHGSAVNLALAMDHLVYTGLPAPARITMNAPLSFDASMQQISMMTLGHHLHIVPRETRFDGPAFVDFLARNRIAMLDITPTHLGLLLQAGLLERGDLALARVSVAGGAIHQAMWDALAASPIRFFDIYGPTECTVNATGTLIDAVGKAPHIGPPLVNYRAYVVDSQLQPLPQGVPGQLCIAGVGLARGYADRGELTARTFVPDPFCALPGQRLYLSGDLARHGQEGIEFLGRIDHQVKIRGYRVELGEVEQCLGAAPGLGRVHVTVFGQAEDRSDLKLVAYYEAGQSRHTPVDLQNFLMRRLPYYMIPATFVPLSIMPLTVNGKVDTKSLPHPDQGIEREHVAPRDPQETDLAAIWATALGTAELGVTEDFFSLGGHSLSLMSTLNAINAHFQSDLTIQDFFEHPTIEGLARKIRERDADLLASDEAAALLAELGDLSPDEIQALLQAEQT